MSSALSRIASGIRVASAIATGRSEMQGMARAVHNINRTERWLHEKEERTEPVQTSNYDLGLVRGGLV